MQSKKKNKDMKVLIASDHAGFELKEEIKFHFSSFCEWEDYGTNSWESVDYPDYIHPMAEKISLNSELMGIIICGSGNGVAMTANKHPNVRAALCWSPEIASLARKHNNANILALPGRFISQEQAFDIINTFFSTDFEGGRHLRRVNKINI